MKRTTALALILSLMLLLGACAAQKSAASTASSESYETDTAAMDGAAFSAEPALAMEAPMESFAVSQSNSGAIPAASAPQAASAEAQQSASGTRKIIYNANLDVTADDPAGALQAVIDKTKALGGYVSGSYTENDDEGAVRSSVTLKVPFDALDALVNAAKATGKVNDYRLSSDDISLQYYDINARLENAKAEEKQLVAILAECKTVEDLLAVRENLSRVRGDIESYQAQINLWDNLVSFATLEMVIRRTPKQVVSAEDDLLAVWKASEVWKNMSRGFQNSIRFVINALYTIGIVLAIAVIPAGILFLCIGLPIILRRRNKRKKQLAAQAESNAALQETDAAKPDAPTAESPNRD